MIMVPHRAQPLLQVPVIREHQKKQNHRRMIRQFQYFAHKALITHPFGLVAFIIDGIFHYNQIRITFPIVKNVPLKPDHSKF